MHEQRMADCLATYNEKPSATKSAGANLLGSIVGMAAGGRADPLSKAARDDYMTEHMEIAAYELLIATAQAFGDTDTIQACSANLRDEVRMANWLEQHLPETVVYSFQEDGIALDKSQIPIIENTVLQCLQQARSGLNGMGAQTNGTTSNAANMPSSTGLGRNPDRMRQSESTLGASGSETDVDYPLDRDAKGPPPTI